MAPKLPSSNSMPCRVLCMLQRVVIASSVSCPSRGHPGLAIISISPCWRRYSVVAGPPRREQVEVPRHSNGSITVERYIIFQADGHDSLKGFHDARPDSKTPAAKKCLESWAGSAVLQLSHRTLFHAPQKSPSILLYLPPGPVLPHGEAEQNRVISLLQESSHATIARINYRASSAHRYPIPCHDVLAGFDWVKTNLLAHDQLPNHARLSVCGELVGGSLATMLALTECRLNEPRIAAAAVNNPIADWVFPHDLPAIRPSKLPEPMRPDETALSVDDEAESEPKPSPNCKRTKFPASHIFQHAWHANADNSILPTLTLTAERDMLFAHPNGLFDRFASPIHFFRSPHAQIVLPSTDDSFASQQPDYNLDSEARLSLSHLAALENGFTPPPAPILPMLSRCRAYVRVYPPTISGTVFDPPAWRISTGAQSPLAGQAMELARRLRQSLAEHQLKMRAGRTRWVDERERDMYENVAGEKVWVDVDEGVGLCVLTERDGVELDEKVRQVGRWVREVMRKEG